MTQSLLVSASQVEAVTHEGSCTSVVADGNIFN